MNNSESDFNIRAKDWDANPMRVERAGAVAQAIRTQIKLTKNFKALEYGCGTGLLSFALQPYLGTITLADSAPGMLEVLGEKINHGGLNNMTPLQLDLVTDNLPPDRFDLIYTLMTMHHIPQLDRVLEAFYTLLLPGGWLCLADLDHEDGSFHDDSFVGHHGFHRSDLDARLQVLGFREVSFMTAFTIHKTISEKSREYTVFLATSKKPGG